MKRLICLLLALMLLPLPATASLEDNLAAVELDVILLDNRTELDQAALRDGSDSTGYDPRSANSFVFATEISPEQPLYQVFLRMNALPASAEIQVKNQKGNYAAVASVQNPGAEFTIKSSEPITGSIRLVIRFDKNTRLQLTECRLFGKGRIPASLHQWKGSQTADVLLLADALCDVDAAQVKAWCDTGSNVAVAVLAKPSGDIPP